MVRGVHAAPRTARHRQARHHGRCCNRRRRRFFPCSGSRAIISMMSAHAGKVHVRAALEPAVSSPASKSTRTVAISPIARPSPCCHLARHRSDGACTGELLISETPVALTVREQFAEEACHACGSSLSGEACTCSFPQTHGEFRGQGVTSHNQPLFSIHIAAVHERQQPLQALRKPEVHM